MSHGIVYKSWITKHNIDGMKVPIGGHVELTVKPDSGYMIGLINITEESTGDKVNYEYSDNQQLERCSIGSPTVIGFNMPNDNVNFWVKFIRIVPA